MKENEEKYKVTDLSPHLFWDVDRDKVKWEADIEFIVSRVLEYGVKKDWEIIKSIYGLELIGKTATKLRSLDEVALNFISVKCDIPLNQFRCYTLQQSIPHFSGY